MKLQSQQWLFPDAPRPKRARMSKFKVKTKVIYFFDNKGMLHKEFVLLEETVK